MGLHLDLSNTTSDIEQNSESDASRSAGNGTLGETEISLVLGGGGGKGVVHVGVLQAVHQQKLRIASIVGTSIGAIWGALLARTLCDPEIEPGRSQRVGIETVEKVAYQLQLRHYRDLDVRAAFTKGFLRGDKFEDWLGTMLWNDSEDRLTSFRDLKFDLTVTATEALSGKSILCNRERTPDLAIARAVRASMSIQGVFRDTMLEIAGEDGVLKPTRCWDGGTTGNCRFDLPLRFGRRRPVIASSLTYRGEIVEVDKGLLRSPWRLSRIRDHTISILMRENEQILEEILDPGKARLLMIRPPLNGLTTFDLDISGERKGTAIAEAKAYALEQITAFRQRQGF